MFNYVAHLKLVFLWFIVRTQNQSNDYRSIWNSIFFFVFLWESLCLTGSKEGEECTIKSICNQVGLDAEKAMAPHSSTLAWKIPWTEDPGGLQSMGLLRIGHDWATSLSLFTFMHWRKQWQSTPVFLPGESQGQGSLVGCCLWGCTESDTTEVI